MPGKPHLPFDSISLAPPTPRFRRRRLVVFLVASTGIFVLFVFISGSKNSSCVPIPRPLGFNSTIIHPQFQVRYRVLERDESPAPLVSKSSDLPASCLDYYFETGVPCPQNAASELRIDFVWTWINSSDPLFRETIQAITKRLVKAPRQQPFDVKNRDSAAYVKTTGRVPNNNNFRDHDELRFSMRSVVQHFRPAPGSKPPRFHVLASDSPTPICNPRPSVRFGQIPQWLNSSDPDDWRHHDISLQVLHHAQIFQPYSSPIFHSYAIESQLANIPSLPEHFVYMNDDFFMTNNLTFADFYSYTFGPVLRFQSDLLVRPHRNVTKGDSHEWQALEHTNGLLSDRFGARHRPYPVHQAKILTRSLLLDEVNVVWKEDIAMTAQRPLRHLSNNAGDMYIQFLYAHYIVERWREGLLWTWMVGKISAPDSTIWSAQNALAAWSDVGGKYGENKVTILRDRQDRESLDPSRVWNILIEEGPALDADQERLRTRYVSSSEDGYPFTGFGRKGSKAWVPEDVGSYDPGAKCNISFDDCFASEGRDGAPVTMDAAFKRIAFDRGPRCGDCIINALVKASGPLGLSAFFPPSSKVYVYDRHSAAPSKSKNKSPQHDDDDDARSSEKPMLPLTLNWRDSDFSMAGVLDLYAQQSGSGSVNLREWSMRMLQRYRFVIGETPSQMIRLLHPGDAKRSFASLAAQDRFHGLDATALLCLNDDIGFGDEQVGGIMREWMEKKWSGPAEWEMDRD